MDGQKISFVVSYNPKTRSEQFTGNKSFIIVDMEKLVPYSTYVLLVFDYFALYIPELWVRRFHYLRTILYSTEWKQSSRVSVEGNIKKIDLTDILLECFHKVDETLDFSFFHECLFYIFQGYTSFIHFRQRQMIRFLIPFIEFLSPPPVEVDYWRKKSKANTLFLLSEDGYTSLT